MPGVTRDRHYADVDCDGRDITIIDTGGFVPGEKDSLLQQVREQAQLAVEECDVIIFVTDGPRRAHRGGPGGGQLPAQERQAGGGGRQQAGQTSRARCRRSPAEFFQLGLGEVFRHLGRARPGRGLDDGDGDGQAAPAVSGGARGPEASRRAEEAAERGRARSAEEAPAEEEAARPIRVAIIGRPNVGKSTLVNALLKEKRVVASEIPGTTRDPIDSELTYKDRKVILTDTAGIRRKKTIAHRVEKFSVVAALKVDGAQRRGGAVDGRHGAGGGSGREAGRHRRGEGPRAGHRGEQVGPDRARTSASRSCFREELKHALKFVGYAPIVFTSALTGSKVEKVLELAVELADQFRYRAPTPQLNRLLEHMADNHPAPIVRTRPLRLYYMAQVGTAPPTFAITCNRPDGVPDMYKRYITNQLAEDVRPAGAHPAAASGSARARPSARRASGPSWPGSRSIEDVSALTLPVRAP